jgi:hypothetical protein
VIYNQQFGKSSIESHSTNPIHQTKYHLKRMLIFGVPVSCRVISKIDCMCQGNSLIHETSWYCPVLVARPNAICYWVRIPKRTNFQNIYHGVEFQNGTSFRSWTKISKKICNHCTHIIRFWGSRYLISWRLFHIYYELQRSVRCWNFWLLGLF